MPSLQSLIGRPSPMAWPQPAAAPAQAAIIGVDKSTYRVLDPGESIIKDLASRAKYEALHQTLRLRLAACVDDVEAKRARANGRLTFDGLVTLRSDALLLLCDLLGLIDADLEQRLRLAVDTEGIVPDTPPVPAKLIAAGSVTATSLRAGAITANQIAAATLSRPDGLPPAGHNTGTPAQS